MDKITLVKFSDHEDNYKLMHKWCSQKFIYEWFEQRILSYDEIVNKYKTKLITRKQELFFVSYNEKNIGFVQIYKYEDNKHDKLNKYNNIYEYDIFIGEEEYLSKGIGTEIVNYINKYIYNKYLADCIILRPFKRNIRAIKCYEKNGFDIIDEYDTVDTLDNKEAFVVLINRKDM